MHMPQHLGPFGTSEKVAAPSAMPQLFFYGCHNFFFSWMPQFFIEGSQ
jgi:hypothetical protein